MKTKLQKQSEALGRRRHNLKTLVNIREECARALQGNASVALDYGWIIVVASSRPEADSWNVAKASSHAVCGNRLDHKALDEWLTRKINAAERDIANLEKKLEGYHG